MSTPHTYISTGPFLPSNSPLSTIFSTNFTKGIQVQRGKLLSWPEPPFEWIGNGDGEVTCISCSPNGYNIVTGWDDRTIRIWDAETGSGVGKRLEGHTGPVRSVAYSPDGQHIISGSSDRTIRIWNAETGSAVGRPLEGHTDSVKSVAYSPDGRYIISGSYDNTIRIWNAETGSAVDKPLEGHAGGVGSVACSPDGRHITSGSEDKTIRIWNSVTDSAAGEPLEGHTRLVSSVAHSPDPQHIISESSDGSIHLRDSFIQTPSRSISNLEAERPDQEGWVIDSEGSLLYWVPRDYRVGLYSPALLTLPPTSPFRSVSLQFDEFAFGTSWTQILKAVPP